MKSLDIELYIEWSKMSCALKGLREIHSSGLPCLQSNEIDGVFWGALNILEESLPRLYELKLLAENYVPAGGTA
jgi:hypothetical protein